MLKTIITRADDCGVSHSANLAIARAADAGFIKNISVMAVCDFLNEAASLLAHRKELCFGLHITLNTEWDNMLWSPLTNAPTLTDSRGCFYSDPILFLQHKPSLDEIMQEVNAQYTCLVNAGFKVSYAECHMLPERYVQGLQARLREWIAQNKLIDFSCYLSNIIPHMDELSSTDGLFNKVLSALPNGQYVYVAHPAEYSKEMLKTGNSQVSGKDIARRRAKDTDFVSAYNTMQICEAYGFRTIRLDEAQAGECRIFTQGSIF